MGRIKKIVGSALAAAALALLGAAPVPALAAQDGAGATACADNQATFDARLIARAKARESALAQGGVDLLQVPSAWAGGTPSVGECRMLFVQVEFPDMPYGEGTTAATLQGMVGACIEGMEQPSVAPSSPYPAESLHGYYDRSSYGKLDVQGYAVRYVAAYERDHYTSNLASLFEEVMDALDASLDYSVFDADGDGYLDGVYLEFSGERGDWGSTWWPAVRTVSESGFAPDLARREFDGKKLSHVALIAEGDGSSAGMSTLIHETGHMLGLPDYYSYDEGAGIGTDDMMGNNTGDQNAFSKWLLGWIDPEDVTRVVVGEDGVRVKRGMGEVESVEGSAEVAVDALTGEASGEGRLLAVSADEGIFGEKSLFTSFYLLQYDQPVGNQSFLGQLLDSGFRMYRIQAGLTPDGSDFAKSNAYGTAHDQLIECLDPSTLSGAGHNDAKQLLLGDRVTPSTTPSTNFFEKALGFTGIDVGVSGSGGAAGRVEVSYDGEDRPDPERFTVSDEGPGIVDSVSYALTCSYAADLNEGCLEIPKLYVDGVERAVGCALDGKKLKVNAYLDPGTIKVGSTCELVLPEGYFVLARSSEGTVTSQEMRVPIKAGPALGVESYFIEAIGLPEDALATGLSNVASGGDGYAYSVESFSSYSPRGWVTSLAVRRITEDDPSSAETTVVDVGDWGGTMRELTLVPLGDGRALLVAAASGSPARLCWLDLVRGEVLAQTDGLNEGAQVTYMGLAGRVVAEVRYASFSLAVLIDPAEDGSLSCRYLAFESTGIFSAGDYVGISQGGAVGYFSADARIAGPRVIAVTAQGFLDLLGSRGHATDVEAWSDVVTASELEAASELPLTGFESPVALAADGDGFYVVTQGVEDDGTPAYFLAAYGTDGALRARVALGEGFEMSQVPWRLRASVDGRGAVAVQRVEAREGYDPASAVAIFQTSDLSLVGRLAFQGGPGCWVGGRWLQVGYPYERDGSIGDQPLKCVYTGVVNPDPTPGPQPPDPEPQPPAPSPDPDPAPGANVDPASGSQARSASASGAAVPATGEPAQPTDFFVLLAVCCLVGAAALRYLASHRNHLV